MNTTTTTDLSTMLTAIVEAHGGRLDYDMWLRVCSGVWSEYSFDESFPILEGIMPEERPGEYARKHGGRLKDVTMGTVIHLAREAGWRGEARPYSPPGHAPRPAPRPAPPVGSDVPGDYSLVETAVGGAANRGRFRPVHSILELDAYGHAGISDAYHSIYRHRPDYAAYAKAHGGVAGYMGPVKADILHFDFDARENPEAARADVCCFTQRVCEKHAVYVDSIRFWWSGNKGFSVFIDDPAVTESAGAADVPERIQGACTALADGLETFDAGVYDGPRLWRIPNSVNSKSGLYKIPLLAGEVFVWRVDRIQERARRQRSIGDACREWLEERYGQPDSN